MSHRLAFAQIRVSLLAAIGVGGLGLGAVACGARVDIPGSSGTSGSGGADPSAVCDGAVSVIAADGTDSGFARCPDGTIHRVFAATCDATINVPPCQGDEMAEGECTTDAECVIYPNAKCGHFEGGFDVPTTYCGCAYSCASDADCGQGNVCVCAGVVDNGIDRSMCAASSTCVTGADCETGECGITSFFDGCSTNVELACRVGGAACRVDAQCPEGNECVTIYGSGIYSCETQNCAIGRPLVVGGAARTAQTRSRGDWISATVTPDLRGLDEAARAALSAHWQQIAALEHASIASFARFTMELLSLGAPPDLVRDAQRAAADEVEHARIAYGLASAYAGRSIGPSGLDLGALELMRSRRDAVRGLVEEACVGETVGVAEALAIADLAEDPALRAVYARIAADEQRHAELAWRSLRWMLDGADDDLRAAARDAFARASEATARVSLAGGRVIARGHGLLAADELAAIRRQAIREVVAPCAAALLGALSGS